MSKMILQIAHSRRPLMSNPPIRESDTTLLTEEQQRQVVERSTIMIEYLSELAVNIVLDFVGKPACETARSVMLNQPEILAVRALQQAWENIERARRRPSDVPLH